MTAGSLNCKLTILYKNFHSYYAIIELIVTARWFTYANNKTSDDQLLGDQTP